MHNQPIMMCNELKRKLLNGGTTKLYLSLIVVMTRVILANPTCIIRPWCALTEASLYLSRGSLLLVLFRHTYKKIQSCVITVFQTHESCSELGSQVLHMYNTQYK